MAPKPLPSPEVLRQLLRYDADTGVLYWRVREDDSSWSKRLAGKPALHCKNSHGYRSGAVMGCRVKAHRAVWAIINGRWPIAEIDHVNGDRGDNRIENLRDVSRQQNAMNRHASFGSSQYKGVKRTRAGKWCAVIKNGPKQTQIGTYLTECEAAQAYNAAALAAFGKFAKLNSV